MRAALATAARVWAQAMIDIWRNVPAGEGWSYDVGSGCWTRKEPYAR